MEIRTLAFKHLVGIFLLLGVLFNSTQVQANEVGTPELIIDDIKCTGNSTTDCDFITKKYYQKVGDVLNPDEIEDAKLRLGTLIQFKSTRIHLEKGSQRDYVVVVFDITEASNIQYDVGYRYEKKKEREKHGSCAYSSIDRAGICLSGNRINDSAGHIWAGKITDFNFLGQGKELSFSIEKSYLNRKDSITTDSQIILWASTEYPELDFTTRDITQFDDENNNYKLAYYDPHLFGSAKYYFRTSIGKIDNFSDIKLQRNYFDSSMERGNGSSKYISENMDMSLGRRFASHSFVSFNIEYNSNARPKNSYTLDYGWNSEDDLLFPTRGSAFLSKFNYNSNSKSLGISYKENFSLATNIVLSLGIDTSIEQFEYAPSSDFLKSGELFARFTNITQVDKTSGVYSGWHASVHYGQRKWNNGFTGTTNYAFNAGYTYQTQSMIYRLSLGYVSQEES